MQTAVVCESSLARTLRLVATIVDVVFASSMTSQSPLVAQLQEDASLNHRRSAM